MSNEQRMLEDLPKILPTFGDPVRIVELGVNDGYHTRAIIDWLDGLHRRFIYVGLEPDPRLHPILPTTVNFVRAAIASEDKMMALHLSEGVSDDGAIYSGSSSLHPPGELIHQYWPKMKFLKTAQVMGVTYDTLCAHHGLDEVDFVWCDTQGCEVDAIKGGPQFFPKTKWFFTEYADARIYSGQATFKELCAMLPDWEVYLDYGGDALLRNKHYDHPLRILERQKCGAPKGT
jgi:FkbM family methyltransferase